MRYLIDVFIWNTAIVVRVIIFIYLVKYVTFGARLSGFLPPYSISCGSNVYTYLPFSPTRMNERLVYSRLNLESTRGSGRKDNQVHHFLLSSRPLWIDKAQIRLCCSPLCQVDWKIPLDPKCRKYVASWSVIVLLFRSELSSRGPITTSPCCPGLSRHEIPLLSRILVFCTFGRFKKNLCFSSQIDSRNKL